MLFASPFGSAQSDGLAFAIGDVVKAINVLKVYPVNVFVIPETISHALECIRMTRDEVIRKRC